jgi:uncharacterized protein (TIGR00299 family) protein
MRLLYLDCFAGCSGDMFLGALLDLGVPEQAVRDELRKLNLTGYSISTRRVVKQNIAATKFDCLTTVADEHNHRGYTEITGLIGASSLAEPVKRRALNVFRRIGEAEARIHDVPLEQIHFHEVGAVDSIVDIVGVCAAIHLLNVDEIRALPPPLGSGFVETAHGRFPLPAPATLELLKGIPTQPTGLAVELVTPTGAALLAECCSQFGPLPAMSVEKIGYGAGSRDLDKTPNVLRAILGEATGTETDLVHILETNLDDMNPQLFGDVMERLLAAGALDVWLTPVQMKKNRPGTALAALCDPRQTDALAELLLTHTTSFGLRITTAQRRKLAREIIRVATRYGEIEVKIGRLAGKIVAWSPEYESCKRAAAAHGVPVKDVQEAALRKRHD